MSDWCELMATLRVPSAGDERSTWTLLVSAYLTELTVKGCGSGRTAETYGYRLRQFLDRFDNPAQATTGEIQIWAYGPSKWSKTASPWVVIGRLVAVSGLYSFAKRLGIVEANPAADIPRPRKPETEVRGVTDPEIHRLLAACRNTSRGLHHRALIVTALLTGLRRRELVGLRGSSFEQRDDGRWFYRLRAKRGRIRHREMPRTAVREIERALATRGKTLDTLKASEQIWQWRNDKTAWEAITAIGERARVRATVHIMRHSAARLQYEYYVSQRRDAAKPVQLFMGHKRLETTVKYLGSLMGDPDEAAEEVAERLGLGEDE